MTSTDYLKILSDHREIREITRKTLKDQAKKINFFKPCCTKSMTYKYSLTINHGRNREIYKKYYCKSEGCDKKLLIKGKDTIILKCDKNNH